MPRTRFRVAVLVATLAAILLALSCIYMIGMRYLEDEPRTFWQSLQWAAGATSTTEFDGDTAWRHPVMAIFVVLTQFLGVTLLFLVLPTFLIPFLEARFETRLPTASTDVRGHVLIFDYGATVDTLISELTHAGIPSLVIDEDEVQARQLVARGQRVIHGNLDDGVLSRCNLAQARALIVNSSDDRNAAAVLVARQLGYTGEILALVEDPYHRQPILLAGASGAYTPRHVLAAALAARASQKVSPTISGIQHLGHRLQVAEARVAPNSALCGQALAGSDIGRHAGVTVIGQWRGGRLIAPPTPDMRLEAGGILVLAGSEASIRSCVDLCEGAHRLRRDGVFVIAGSGEVGRKVAQLLQDCGEKTFVIDSRDEQGVDLVGNVLDGEILRQADLGNAQAVILALNSDSTALFGAMLVKEVAPDVPVIARVNRAENVERLYLAGADFALSVDQVSGQLLAFRLLGKESVRLDPELRVVKVSSRGLETHHPKEDDLRERTGCTVIAVERGDELLVQFDAGFRFQSDDAVYVCGNAEATEKFFELYPRGRKGPVA